MSYYYSGFMHALLFLVGALTGASILYLKPSETVEQLLPAFITAIATLLAAYFGAKFAFQNQATAQKKIENQRNKANASKTVIKLVEMVNHLASLEQQLILQKLGAGEFKFMAIISTDTTHMKVSIDEYEIFFLFDDDNINTLAEFSMVKARYYSLIEAINERSLLHKEAQEIFTTRDIPDYSLLTLADIKSIIGDRHFYTLCSLTDDIIKLVPENVQKINDLIENINVLIKQHFPEVKTFSVDMSKYEEIQDKTV
jgi:hypothetical protein